MQGSVTRCLGWLLGLGLAANSLMMLGAPVLWYATVPGAGDTGPLNAHFVRDIGVAYLVCGASLLWFTVQPSARPAAAMGAAFLALHALVHLWDGLAGREAAHRLLLDLPAVFLPAALAIGIAWLPLGRPATQDRGVSVE